MSHRKTEPTTRPKERAFLVGLELRSATEILSMEDSLTELSLLADTAGLEVVGATYQRLDKPNVNTYIGPGKVDEILLLAEDLAAEIVIFDNELSPRHLRELEEKFGLTVRVMDRTSLILDIFAQHANTREGVLQVELAQYEYRLPRLTRAWTHLVRQAGGGGGRTGSVGGVGLRGPGETQLEVDRREIRKKIDNIKKDLEKVRTHRELHRIQRRRSKIPVVALVGYTNAGKSTLINTLSSSNVYVADQLFATLDPTTRRVILPKGNQVLFTDTVGFIQKLPAQLIAAFRATLEDIIEADLLIHVVDGSHVNALSQWQSVQSTLIEIGAGAIPMITVINKIDLAAADPTCNIFDGFSEYISISALKKVGIDKLESHLESTLFDTLIPIRVKIPLTEGRLISMFHDKGKVKSTQYVADSIIIKGSIPKILKSLFQPYLFKSSNSD